MLVKRTRRGRGIGSVLGNLADSIFGLGRRRRVHSKRGGTVCATGGKRRRVRRIGRGFLDTLKSVASVALPYIKQSGVAGDAAKLIPGIGGPASAIVKSLGWGKLRSIRRRRRIGGLRKRRVIRV